jgi:hypothetical protein
VFLTLEEDEEEEDEEGPDVTPLIDEGDDVLRTRSIFS